MVNTPLTPHPIRRRASGGLCDPSKPERAARRRAQRPRGASPMTRDSGRRSPAARRLSGARVGVEGAGRPATGKQAASSLRGLGAVENEDNSSAGATASEPRLREGVPAALPLLTSKPAARLDLRDSLPAQADDNSPAAARDGDLRKRRVERTPTSVAVGPALADPATRPDGSGAAVEGFVVNQHGARVLRQHHIELNRSAAGTHGEMASPASVFSGAEHRRRRCAVAPGQGQCDIGRVRRVGGGRTGCADVSASFRTACDLADGLQLFDDAAHGGALGVAAGPGDRGDRLVRSCLTPMWILSRSAAGGARALEGEQTRAV